MEDQSLSTQEAEQNFQRHRDEYIQRLDGKGYSERRKSLVLNEVNNIFAQRNFDAKLNAFNRATKRATEADNMFLQSSLETLRVFPPESPQYQKAQADVASTFANAQAENRKLSDTPESYELKVKLDRANLSFASAATPAEADQAYNALKDDPTIPPAKLLQAKRRPGQSEASAAAEAFGQGLEDQQTAALQLAKYDAAVAAAKEKAKKSGTGSFFTSLTGAQLGTGDPDDEYYGEVTIQNGKMIPVGAPKKTYDISDETKDLRKAFDERKILKVDNQLRDLETYIQKLAKAGQGGDLPGFGFFGGRNPMPSTKGKVLRAKFAALKNTILKERSGAAVTTQEMERVIEELAGGETTRDEKAFLTVLRDMRRGIEKEKLEVINQFKGSKALDKYLKNEGIGIYESPTFILGATKSKGTFTEIEGRPTIDIDGKQTAFIGGRRFIYDPKRGKFFPAKDKPKSKQKK